MNTIGRPEASHPLRQLHAMLAVIMAIPLIVLVHIAAASVIKMGGSGFSWLAFIVMGVGILMHYGSFLLVALMMHLFKFNRNRIWGMSGGAIIVTYLASTRQSMG